MRNEMQNALNEAGSLDNALTHSTVTLDQCFEEFQEQTPEFFEYFSDKAVWAMFTLAEAKMKETGNSPSVSLFHHCFVELKAIGLPKLRRRLPEPGPEEKDESNMTPQEFLQLYNSLPIRQIQYKFSHNADFKRQVNKLIELGWI